MPIVIITAFSDPGIMRRASEWGRARHCGALRHGGTLKAVVEDVLQRSAVLAQLVTLFRRPTACQARGMLPPRRRIASPARAINAARVSRSGTRSWRRIGPSLTRNSVAREAGRGWAVTVAVGNASRSAVGMN